MAKIFDFKWMSFVKRQTSLNGIERVIYRLGFSFNCRNVFKEIWEWGLNKFMA